MYTGDCLRALDQTLDNVFIERLWRSVKYEEVNLHEHATIPNLYAGLADWFRRYNTWRAHEALGNQTPEAVCRSGKTSQNDAPATALDQAA